MHPLISIITLCILALGISQTKAQQVVGDWTFHPNYTLHRNAKNYPGNRIDMPQSRFEIFKTLGEPLYFYNQRPTKRLTNFIDNTALPKTGFTVELWLLNHVNLPVGTLICVRDPEQPSKTPWLLGYFDNEAVFHVETDENHQQSIQKPVTTGWKKYWRHLVASFDGTEMALYLNGEEIARSKLNGQLDISSKTQIEIAGYFANEPYMDISNLLKSCRLHDGVLSSQQIAERFESLTEQVEQGAFFPDTLHFNAGPYLHYATQNSMNILWETNYPTTATIEYGTTLPMDKSITIPEAKYIHEITLTNLEPATTYYYRVNSTSDDEAKMTSNILTFGTAGLPTDLISFCVIGDTESRPHINNRLGEMIWEERPNFIMHLGDITDGGKKPHKFEWNYEYFTGILPVASRIPIFPVAGNGEGDLYWYKKYHRLPDPEGYYSFTYGNAEFFMLNSNANEELVKGGVQHDWLKEALAKSKARWKFVAHHHCPISSDENDFGDTWKGVASTHGDPKFDDLKSLYESAGVDVVFFGHVHAYERTYPLTKNVIDADRGVYYIKSGGGGGHLEDFVPTHNAFSNKIQRGNHFLKIDIFNETFSLKMYDIEGRLKDVFELKK